MSSSESLSAGRVFPHPRPVLRRGCAALGREAARRHAAGPEALAARYILPSSPVYADAKRIFETNPAPFLH